MRFAFDDVVQHDDMDDLTRTGLDLMTRELLTFAILASMGGCEPQLAGHVAGKLAMGNDRQVIINAVTQLLPYIGYPRTLNAILIINCPVLIYGS